MIKASVTTTALLLATVVSGLCALPSRLFPAPWLLAFLLPGVLYHSLTLSRLAARLGFAFRLGSALALQGVLALLLIRGEVVGPEATLTLQLMAPLAFLVIRRQDNDVLLATFLAFCLLLIGTMLQRPAPLVEIVLFVVFATLSLHQQTLLHTVRESGGHGPHRISMRGRQFLVALSLVIAVLLTAFLSLVAFRELPGQTRPERSNTEIAQLAAPRLRNDFDLASGGGIPLDFSAEEILRVFNLLNAPLPPDLYLRCSFFDVPSLDRWETSSIAEDSAVTVDATDFKVKDAVPGEPVQSLHIKARVDHDGLLFVPSGVTRILDLAQLRANARHGWFRNRQENPGRGYRLSFQNLEHVVAGRSVDRQLFGRLTRLPSELRTNALRSLAREFTKDLRNRTEHQVALALAEGLRRRCVYKLEEPAGSSDHALLNFLFGSRSGYCMHFASALAVLLRLEGVPCRIAVGLHGGHEVKGEPRTRIFAGTDAHAWVEVPYQDIGWISYDATQGVTLAGERWPESRIDAEPLTEEDRAPSSDDDPLHQALARLFTLLPWLLPFCLCLLLWPLFPASGRRPLVRGGTHPEAKTARRQLEQILLVLARSQRARPEGSTLEQFAARLDNLPSEVRDPLRAAFAAYQEVRFGGRPLDPERTQRLAEGLKAAERLLK